MRTFPREMSALGALLACGTGCFVEVQTTSDAVSFSEAITAVVVDVGEGDVHLIGADMVGAEVYRSMEWSRREPEVSAWVDGSGVLYVEARCPVASLRCRVDHELVVPIGASVELMTGSGDIQARGVQAPVWAETGSGDVELTNITGQTHVDTGSGAVFLQSIAGDLEVSTGSGDIDGWELSSAQVEAGAGSGDIALQLGAALRSLDVSTGSGDVDLEVPTGAYALDIDTGSGKISLSGVQDQREAPRWIDVDTGSGDVSVVGR